MSTKYNTDEAGNVIDPPVIPEFERRLRDATASGDTDAINAVAKEYDNERKKRAGVGARSKPDDKKSGAKSKSDDKKSGGKSNTKSGGTSS